MPKINADGTKGRWLFVDTVDELRKCYEQVKDCGGASLSEIEHRYAKELFELCGTISENEYIQSYLEDNPNLCGYDDEPDDDE